MLYIQPKYNNWHNPATLVESKEEGRLKDILGMHIPLNTYFCSSVLFCLLSVFGNRDERMTVWPPAFTCVHQLHGNVQVCMGKRSQELPITGLLCSLRWSTSVKIGSVLAAYAKHNVHAWCHTSKGLISIIITNVACSIKSSQNSATLQEKYI